MTERIIVEVDDSQLTAVLVKLNRISAVARTTVGGRTIGGRGTEFASALPAINRELRLILGQLPGMTEAIRMYFRLKRLERGVAFGGTNLWLSIIATIIVLFHEITGMQRRLDRERQEFERFVMQTRGFTKQELQREQTLWKYYLRGQPT